jgi:hypothetical protein
MNKQNGRNCNLQLSLTVNADAFDESYVIKVDLYPEETEGRLSDKPITIMHYGLCNKQEEAFTKFKLIKDVMYAIQANPELKLTRK